MGIKLLNKYIRDRCTHASIQTRSISEFSGKIITVDISIYLYKFLGDSAHVVHNPDTHSTVMCDMNIYMEHLYSFLSIFYYYKITPIFVFDGKPPPEKRALLKKRYAEKKEAETKYDELDDAMMIREEQDESDQYQKMNELCKKMVRIKSEQLKQTKDLMSAFGYTYIQSAGEADRICVQYVLQGKAWACLSDDMDMLLLGCPRIFRNLYTQSHTWILYESASIFAELGISRNKMVETLVSKGATDYYSVNDDANCNAETQDNNANANKNINLTQVLDHLRNKCESEPEISEEIHQICSLFEIQENMYEGEVQENAFNIEEIQRIMSPVGFVFI